VIIGFNILIASISFIIKKIDDITKYKRQLLRSRHKKRPLKNSIDYRSYDFCQFFRKGAVKLTTKYTQIWTMACDQAVY